MKRQVRVEFAGVIFAALLFVLMVGLVEIVDPDRLGFTASPGSNTADSATVEMLADSSEQPDCTQMESEFASKLEQSRSCLVDADCSLASFECPFECVASITGTIFDDLQREERSFQRTCHRCESSCPETLIKWRAACVRQRCIVLDRSIEELQEETLRIINESG